MAFQWVFRKRYVLTVIVVVIRGGSAAERERERKVMFTESRCQMKGLGQSRVGNDSGTDDAAEEGVCSAARAARDPLALPVVVFLHCLFATSGQVSVSHLGRW